MSPGQIAAENHTLLSYTWEWLRAGRSSNILGVDNTAASLLRSFDRREILRAADCHVPLFRFACSPDMLKNALLSDGAFPLDERAETFLANRWRSAASLNSGEHSLLGMGKRMAEVLHDACFTSLSRAARAGIQVIHLNVRPQYLHHAGRNLAMQPAHRSQLAVLNTAPVH